MYEESRLFEPGRQDWLSQHPGLLLCAVTSCVIIVVGALAISHLLRPRQTEHREPP